MYGKSQHAQFVEPYFGCYDPLSYPLFFPNGEVGWHNKVPRHGVDIDDIVNNANDEDHIDEDEDEAAEGLNTISLTSFIIDVNLFFTNFYTTLQVQTEEEVRKR